MPAIEGFDEYVKEVEFDETTQAYLNYVIGNESEAQQVLDFFQGLLNEPCAKVFMVERYKDRLKATVHYRQFVFCKN